MSEDVPEYRIEHPPPRLPDGRTPAIAIIGLGYVGTPLLAAFAEHFTTLGFDISAERVAELQRGEDRTLELNNEELARVKACTLTTNPDELRRCDVFIVTVPTPVTEDKQPDMEPLRLACELVGPALKAGATVIFESTVYPGATEEYCLPILERLSGLKGGQGEGFWYGYSPERINPGDAQRRLQNIVKVVSGCCAESLDFIDVLYSSIIPAGTHKAPSVRVAEAAKVIENTQRDVNIALINELSMLFDKLNLDTQAVLAAAGTKWNFLPFTPGLVGGHCIGVDPYYLTWKAREVGFDPQIILAGRTVNDGMAPYWAGRVLAQLRDKGIEASGARVLVLGLTFKENCPDTRNSQVFRLIAELEGAGCVVEVMDPWVSQARNLVKTPAAASYQAIIGAVAHQQFRELEPATIAGWAADHCVYISLKQGIALPGES